MDSPLRFSCPECGKELKAPREYAGKRVRCTKPDCRHSFPIPGDARPAPLPHGRGSAGRPLPLPNAREDDFGIAPARNPRRARAEEREPAPRRRGFPVLLVSLAAVVLVVLGTAIGGGYWWMGQPTSAQAAIYDNYIRTGNELVDLHGPVTTEKQAKEAHPKLLDKAEENMEFRRQLRVGGRRERKLREQYDRPIQDLNRRIAQLMQSDKPLAVLSVCSNMGKPEMIEGAKDAPTSPRCEYYVVENPGLAAKRSTTEEDTKPVETTPTPLASARDPELEGEWKMTKLYYLYTGPEQAGDNISTGVNLRIGDGKLVLDIPLDGVRTTKEYALALEPDAKPNKKYKITNVADATDVHEGIYRIDIGGLLMRSVPGKKGWTFTLPTENHFRRISSQDKDSDIPQGFLMKKAEEKGIFRYEKVGLAPPVEPPALAIREVTGEWEGHGFSIAVKADGQGVAVYTSATDGGFHVSTGRFTVDLKDGRPHIAFALTAALPLTGADAMPKFEFSVLEKPTPDSLVVKELGGKIKPNPITLTRRPPEKKDVAEVWKDVPLPTRDTATRLVVYDAKGGHSIFGGTTAIVLMDVPGKGFQGTPILDNPGSFWFIGKGGVDWKGTKFPEASIVAVDDDRIPAATKGDHRALIASKTDILICATRTAEGAPIATVKPRGPLQLLMADADAKGIHKVRMLDGEKREGWIKGGWDTMVFQRRE